jgi:lipid-binding SYLF domain-containing protein
MKRDTNALWPLLLLVAFVMTATLGPGSRALAGGDGYGTKHDDDSDGKAASTEMHGKHGEMMHGDKKARGEAHERARMAGKSLRELMKSEDHAVPDYLLEKAHGIAVIPSMKKGALGIGGSGGKGLIATRLEDGQWSTPLFVSMGGASFGAQAGVQSTDLVLVFTDKKGLEALMKDKVKLGGEISVAAGPVGRTAEAGTNVTLDSAIYSYSRSKGLFAGASFEGTVLEIDDSANRDVFGESVDAGRVLDGKVELDAPDAVESFVVALRDVASMSGTSSGTSTGSADAHGD